MQPVGGGPPNLLALLATLSHEDEKLSGLEICSWHQRHVLRALALVHVGPHDGEWQPVGWSFGSDDQPFPEYPPHWFHVLSEFDDGRAGGTEEAVDEQGRYWRAYSRPFGEQWTRHDRVASTVLQFTVKRFWSRVR